MIFHKSGDEVGCNENERIFLPKKKLESLITHKNNRIPGTPD
jgi:hypothetical protein